MFIAGVQTLGAQLYYAGRDILNDDPSRIGCALRSIREWFSGVDLAF